MTTQVVQYFHMYRQTYSLENGEIVDSGWAYQHGPIFTKEVAFITLPEDVEWASGGKSMYKVMESVIEVKESVDDS